jgi:hypothetical protein
MSKFQWLKTKTGFFIGILNTAERRKKTIYSDSFYAIRCKEHRGLTLYAKLPIATRICERKLSLSTR